MMASFYSCNNSFIVRLRIDIAGDSQISNLDFLAILSKENVHWLQISMDEVQLMEMLDAQANLEEN